MNVSVIEKTAKYFAEKNIILPKISELAKPITINDEIKGEFKNNNIDFIQSTIIESAFITGEQKIYIDDADPFPEGYKLNDTWPSFGK